MDNYERNLNLYYKLYDVIGKPIRFYKNRYIDSWIQIVGNFSQKGYLAEKYYKEAAALDIFKNIMGRKSIMKYQYEHGFVPIWIIIDAMSEEQFCKLLMFSKENFIKEVFMTENVERMKNVLSDIVELCEERMPLLNEGHMLNSVEDFCVAYRNSLKK